MSLGLAHRKELKKRRNQRFWSFFKFTLFILILIGSSYYSFDTGQKITRRNMASNTENFNRQTAELEKMRTDLGNLKADRSRLQKLLPNKEIRDILRTANIKMSEGIAPERITRLIAGLSKDVNCGELSQAKRFVISTPVSQNNDSSASFYRGLIMVTGKGSPTLNEDGNPEAWFDPAKPANITFTLPGGETQNITGILPLYHSVILEGTEYRFTINSGRRSFADIIIRKCDL